jgi:putative membrane protein
MKILIHVVLGAIAVFVSSRLLTGVHIDSFATALTVSIVLGIVNAVLRPILLILTLPITIVTLGFFTLIVIGACVLLVARLVPGFHVDSMGWALAFSFVLWIVNGFLHAVEPK